MGPITPVFSVGKNIFNFVFMARGCIFADAPVIRTNFTSSFGGDVLCLKGVNGEQMWGKHFNKMPNDLDCSILSIKNEAQKDCIIISYSNFVAVLSSGTGKNVILSWQTIIVSFIRMKNTYYFLFFLQDKHLGSLRLPQKITKPSKIFLFYCHNQYKIILLTY